MKHGTFNDGWNVVQIFISCHLVTLCLMIYKNQNYSFVFDVLLLLQLKSIFYTTSSNMNLLNL